MAPPPLPPLSSVAGSLALTFTSATQPPAPSGAVTPARTAPASAPATTSPAATPARTPAAATPPASPASSAAPGPASPAAAAVVPAPPATAPVAAATPAVATAPAAPAPTVPPPVVARKYEAPVKVRPPLLRPTEKRFFFTLFVGGAKTLRGGYGGYGNGMDFKIEGAIGGHSKKRPTLGGAAVIQVTAGFPFSSFTLAPRLQWDKQIVPEYAIYFTTTAMLGYRVMTYSGYGLIYGLIGGYHGAVAGVGWGVSAILAERLLLTFRPVNPEVQYSPGLPAMINWDVLGGIGVIW